jgi:hypothetical protein
VLRMRYSRRCCSDDDMDVVERDVVLLCVLAVGYFGSRAQFLETNAGVRRAVWVTGQQKSYTNSPFPRGPYAGPNAGP